VKRSLLPLLFGGRRSRWAFYQDFMAGALDPRWTFSRASLATMFNSAGQLVYAPHNLARWSEAFSDPFWAKAGTVPAVVTADAALAPDGTLTADLIDLTPSADARVAQNITEIPSGFPVTVAVWLRAPTGQSGTVALQIRNAAGSTPFTLVSITDQWARYSFTTPASTGTNTAIFWCGTRGSGGTQLTFFAWGASIEFASTVGTYQKTGGSSALYHGPRFAFDPVTLQPLGLQFEGEPRMNTCLQSANLSDAVWTKSFVSVGATLSGPIGAVPLVVPSTATNLHNLAQSVTTSAGSTTISFVAKAGGYTKVGFREGTATGVASVWDLAAGAAVVAAGLTTGGMEHLGGGWYRCFVTMTATAGARAHLFFLLDAAFTGNSPHTYTWTGDGTSGIYLGAFQVEQGASASSIIPTQAAAVTRSADLASMTGASFSNWFAVAPEFTLFAEGSSNFAGTATFVTLDDGSNNNNACILASRSRNVSGGAQSFSGGALQADWTLANPFSASNKKVAFRVRTNSQRWALNGAFVSGATEDTSCTMPAGLDRLILGNRSVGEVPLMGFIRALGVARRGFSDTELQAVTA
jgi:hypothetical protein